MIGFVGLTATSMTMNQINVSVYKKQIVILKAEIEQRIEILENALNDKMLNILNNM